MFPSTSPATNAPPKAHNRTLGLASDGGNTRTYALRRPGVVGESIHSTGAPCGGKFMLSWDSAKRMDQIGHGKRRNHHITLCMACTSSDTESEIPRRKMEAGKIR
mmetsp:Transcript_107569/g.285099  ORF Transcript_107569/g.285099 Transcript_107569/m.285099 type:complete len:105 (-) Transcript_107569:360-674(-)